MAKSSEPANDSNHIIMEFIYQTINAIFE